MSNKEQLKKLREPFELHQISKLPKPTRAQTEAVKRDYKSGIRCKICGGWHHPDVIHLDYVGHAALTDRLLSVDPEWNWSHAYLDDLGYPIIDKDGGMWIKLTVCGVTRLGYGDAQGKTGGDAMKERIGDALRNAAMRFGCALDLWHKGNLHLDKGEEAEPRGNESELLSLIVDGNEFEVARYWRSLTQEGQQAEWNKIDKDSQKEVKRIMQIIPPEQTK